MACYAPWPSLRQAAADGLAMPAGTACRLIATRRDATLGGGIELPEECRSVTAAARIRLGFVWEQVLSALQAWLALLALSIQ